MGGNRLKAGAGQSMTVRRITAGPDPFAGGAAAWTSIVRWVTSCPLGGEIRRRSAAKRRPLTTRSAYQGGKMPAYIVATVLRTGAADVTMRLIEA